MLKRMRVATGSHAVCLMVRYHYLAALPLRADDKSMAVKSSTFPLLQNLPWDDVVVLLGHELVFCFKLQCAAGLHQLVLISGQQ